MPRGCKKKSAVEEFSDLKAVASIISILSEFEQDTQSRILEWVNEKLGRMVSIRAERPRQIVRNPHEGKVPFGRVIVQEDDVNGEIVNIPEDED